MNAGSNMLSRRPAAIRQHSLQQPAPRRQQQQQQQQQQIRRQRSSEDAQHAKGLQIYPAAKPSSRRIVSTDSVLERPKVRIAWGEQPVRARHEGVEIVARQIASFGGSRGARSGYSGRCHPEKATILYSRQELAERLRLAWRQREENKSNIDIFLARSAVEEGSDSRTTTPGPQRKDDLAARQEDRGSDDKVTKDDDNNEEEENVEDYLFGSWFSSGEHEEETAPKKPSISISWNEAVKVGSSNSSNRVRTSAPATPTKESQSAKLRRAGFQSGSNKAFVGPTLLVDKSTPRLSGREMSSRTYRRTSSAPPQRRVQVSIVIDTPGIPAEPPPPPPPEKKAGGSDVCKRPPIKRRIKAGRRRGGGSKDGDEAGKSGPAELVTMVSLVSSADSESEMDETSPRDDKLISELRSKLPTNPIIKSSNGLAGVRKPFKSVSFQQDSFDCESPPSPPSIESVISGRTSLQARFAALSRANSAAPSSESNSPLISAAISAWKNELLTQHQPMQQQRLVVASSLVDVSACSPQDVPLTDREKRCLAVPIGDVRDKKRKLIRCKSAVAATRVSDSDRRSSDGSQACLQAEMRMSRIMSQQSTSLVNLQQESTSVTKVITIPLTPAPTESSTENAEKDKTGLPAEPYCQTPKEKECWHLYKKMCDKGVFVSFDTVLRGMLTPTEYRLRQKELSQNC